jgi:hypothetical protein
VELMMLENIQKILFLNSFGASGKACKRWSIVIDDMLMQQ